MVHGVSREATAKAVLALLSIESAPSEVDFSELTSNCRVWAKYCNSELASSVAARLDSTVFHGSPLSVKMEAGMDSSGRRVVPKDSHSTEIRKVSGRNVAKQKRRLPKNKKGVSYSHKSMFVGETEYPFPSGLYLTRIIEMARKLPADDPLLRILCDTTQSRYAKETSEAMSMADAVDRSIRLVYGRDPRGRELNEAYRVVCYMLGDGKEAAGAAACCLHFPSSWEYVSIDPINETRLADLGPYSHQIEPYRGVSQDYSIIERGKGEQESAQGSTLSGPTMPTISIAVACHSHAPLAEFWARLPFPKIAVTMACCSDFCESASIPTPLLPSLHWIYR